MAKTIEITIYKFQELSEEAQEKALRNLYDLNVDHEWWDFTYEDAATVGIKLTGFDVGRGQSITGDIEDEYFTALRILEEHGKECETYKTAEAFTSLWAKLIKKHSDGVKTNKVAEENIEAFHEELEESNIVDEFKKAILEDYLVILSKEYEYLTSDEAIKETIEANDYDFTEEGDLY
jgi:hypothetical protein